MADHGKHKKRKGKVFPFNIRTDWVPVFATGFYPQNITDDNPHGEVDVALLQDAADSYDPDGSLAPITVDHEQSGKSGGWIDRFKVIGDRLFMKARTVTDEMFQSLEEGEYLYPSIEMYDPQHHANPVPGRWYVRAVTFLGAGAPQVKGLFEGFYEAWIAPDAKGRVLCFSQFNRNEESEMTPEEIQKLVDASVKKAVKTTTETLTKKFSEDFEKQLDDKLKERDDDHQTELDEQAKKDKKDKRDLSVQFSEMKDDFSSSRSEVKALKDERAADKLKAREGEIHLFCETLKRDGYLKPATVDDKIKPRLTAQVDNPNGLKAVMDSIMDGAEKGKFFSEASADPAESAKNSGIELHDEAGIRHYSSSFGNENATKESADLARAGIGLFRERTKGGAKPTYAERKQAMIDAQKAGVAA